MKSKIMQEYFNKIKEDTFLSYEVANRAKKKGFDPDNEVSILLTENMAERVEGLVSVAAPQIKNSGLIEEIVNIEKKYGAQDWRVAFKIAEKVAKQELCKFKDKREAMEVALRVGLAYITNGVVSSPLEGFVRLELKKRKDGKEYFCLYFSGPIRSAGTTAVCVFVVLSDYIRKIMGYFEYDPTKEEIKRSSCEVHYFHERATNLQYLPSEKEIEFLTEHLPVQIDGDPSEKIDAPNYKDLVRIGTNRLRNGFCLVMAEGLSQKFPKFWGKFSKWYLDFGMDHWIFIEKYIELQKEIKSKGEIKKGSDAKISPNYTYIKDLVAGRPILSYPLRIGGFRLRYGRARNSGFSAEAVHPATLFVLNNYLAIGTQLRTERPNKSTVLSICDSIEGPIVKLKNGDVLFVESAEQAKNIINEIKEILFLGDILINYGDFLVFNHVLVPAGYCEEWWNLELEKVYNGGDDKINKILNYPYNLAFDDAYEISKKYKIPFYPKYVYHWNDINYEQFSSLINWLNHAVIKDEKIILPYSFSEDPNGPKRALEILGVPHKVVSKEYVIIEGDWCNALKINLGFYNKKLDLKFILKKVELNKPILEGINNISSFRIRDKSGTFIGARMGRPEKSKIRKMIGSPHILFPIGDEGGRLRCFQGALEKGKVKAQFSVFKCDKCNKETIYPLCEKCRSLTKPIWICKNCGRIDYECEHNPIKYDTQELDIKYYFKSALELLGLKEYPSLIKGVRGTSNKDHHPEHLTKGILRAIHNIYVNKDGTVRYDMTEMPITHFKPKEIRSSIEKLEKLGYTKDIYGKDLIDDNQILELKCQDIILPSCPESLEEGADSILFRVANFIDDLLEKLYGMEKYFNFNSKEDLIGHYVVSLSPHTSAGVVARIIGFSKTQGFLAHPFLHSIMRRDCVHPGTKVFFYNKETKEVFYGELGDYIEKLIKKGAKTKKIDSYGTLLIDNKKPIYTFGIDPITHKLKQKRIKYFIKGPKTKKWVKVTTATNREYIMTPTHKFMYVKNNKFKFKEAKNIKVDDQISVLENFNFNLKTNEINLIKLFKEKLNDSEQKQILVIDGNKETDLFSFSGFNNNLELRWKFSKHKIPSMFKINKEFMRILGYYTSEGYYRQNKSVSQVCFRICNKEMQDHIVKLIEKTFNIKSSCGEENSKITICSKLVYYIFKSIDSGKGAYEKRVPTFIFGLDNKLVKEYISSFFEGDGSIIKDKGVISFYSVSRNLLDDIALLLAKFEIFGRYFRTKPRLPGRKVLERYKELGKKPKKHILNHLVLGVYDSFKFKEILNIVNKNKIKNLIYLKYINKRYIRYNKKQILLEKRNDYVLDYIKKIEIIKDEKNSYCVEIDWNTLEDRNILWGEQIINTRCDGDEAGIMLLMDALLNFSRNYLPAHRGATQDEPLVLNTNIIASEVDEMVYDMDVCWKYPLELYEAALEYKRPHDLKLDIVRSRLGTENQYEGFGFTNNVEDINEGVRCSAYKTIPTMEEKVIGQMDLAEKIRAVDSNDVAKLIIDRHFIRDIKGNLRKFFTQQFRCVSCNEKYRRIPLSGICRCGGKLIFTVSEGNIKKYLEPSLSLSKKYELPLYLKQSLELVKQRVDSTFGKEKDKQEGLGKWFG